MTAFVILAAGRGSRIGRVGGDLHKALLPLGGKAVLSHLLELAPPNARFIVCVGDRAEQIRNYVELAHPNLDVTFVYVQNWQMPGSGPGRSLLTARDLIGDDDVVFTSCDTMWTHSDILWKDMSTSWVAYAPIPAGTEPQRWCRLNVRGQTVVSILDKTSTYVNVSDVYTGMAHVKKADIDRFWDGVLTGQPVEDELQVTGGLQALCAGKLLDARRIDWIDTGDVDAYRRAVALYSGYDWTKTDQATYVLPKSGRVVKYMADSHMIDARWTRGHELQRAVPECIRRHKHMLAYDYIDGETVYERLARYNDITYTQQLLKWRDKHLTKPVYRAPFFIHTVVRKFYHDKTMNRIRQLRAPLRDQAYDEVSRIDFDALVNGFKPGIPHGDFNFGNVIITPNDEFIGIDWREDFVGASWFDLRYDVAKLLAGTVVHWDNARRGDFTPWDAGQRHADVIRDYIPADSLHSVEVIAALSLINSAPLHAAPLDEVLVARGCAWLEQLA